MIKPWQNNLCLLLCLLSACAQKIEKPTERLVLEPTSFADIDGWTDDDQSEALVAFLKSCAVLEKKDPSTKLGIDEAGQVADWLLVCAGAKQTNKASARQFFETTFVPYRITNQREGLFTGYYEAELHGSRKKEGPYQTPLYERPQDMITADLGAFKETLKGQKITGKVQGAQFIPYDQRASIVQGVLENRAKPVLWVDDPIDAFFLEIQGSGHVLLPDGQTVYVGYAAQNGHEYVPIGRVLAQQAEIEKPVTMQKIRRWLQDNPKRAQEIMNTNPSYVFFKEKNQAGAVGAQGVVLTPLRSLAVDRSFIPLGVPLWLDTNEHKRLVVAQDTGGAIKGAVRGDLFWGAGKEAENKAGEMQNTGTYILLLPKKGAL